MRTKLRVVTVAFLFVPALGYLTTEVRMVSHASTSTAQTLEVVRNGAEPSRRGSVETFTGEVRIGPPFQANPPSRILGASVTFEPGARTAWHTHPLGQILVVTAGAGWVRRWGGPLQNIHLGDVVRIPPGVKHWHGATATSAMTHVAIVEQLDGKSVDWMEKVGDEQYGQ